MQKLIIVLLVVLLIAALSPFGDDARRVVESAVVEKVTVAELKASPGEYHDRSVLLLGTVKTTYGVAGSGIFKLDDGTGMIDVVTSGGLPELGVDRVVRGRLIQVVTFDGQNIVAIQEE